MVKSVLFICTGNTCRSVLAEHLFRHYASQAGLEIKVASAGLHAQQGREAEQHTLAVLGELGIDAGLHRAQPLHPDLIFEYDLILTMTAAQREQVLSLFPELKPKVFLLKELAVPSGQEPGGALKDILDPFGQPLARYRESRREIKTAVKQLIQNWSEGRATMKIVIGADHGGFAVKKPVIEFLESKGFQVEDFGTFSEESCDYPEIAHKVGQAVASGQFEAGVLICGTGIGVSLAANKVPGIRAGLAHNTFSARMAKAHNNCNILCLGARVTGIGLMLDIVDAYFQAEYEGGRHARRVAMIEEVQKQ
ncbi:MAG: ribose 5-phosphate isomerase B [Firmicutes bacterium]|nr:ribose 5-phosphate isomerase B [Bacillota bacterium]